MSKRDLIIRTSSDEELEMAIQNSLNDKLETTTTCLTCTLKNEINNKKCVLCHTELPFYKWKSKYLKKSLDDGNCLYSSVYRVLHDKNKLSIVRDILELNIDNEGEFIKSLRYKISDSADNDIKYFLNNKEIYKKSDMGNFSLTSLEGALEEKSTLQTIKDKIKKDKVYATFIEYFVIKRFLEACDIEIILITNEVFNKDKIEHDIDAENIIYIYNYNNSHYQYFYSDKKHKDGRRKKSKSFRRKKSKLFRRKKSKSFRRKKSKSFRRKKSKSFRRKNDVIYKQK
jgi:hypothetical protein